MHTFFFESTQLHSGLVFDAARDTPRCLYISTSVICTDSTKGCETKHDTFKMFKYFKYWCCDH